MLSVSSIKKHWKHRCVARVMSNCSIRLEQSVCRAVIRSFSACRPGNSLLRNSMVQHFTPWSAVCLTAVLVGTKKLVSTCVFKMKVSFSVSLRLATQLLLFLDNRWLMHSLQACYLIHMQKYLVMSMNLFLFLYNRKYWRVKSLCTIMYVLFHWA